MIFKLLDERYDLIWNQFRYQLFLPFENMQIIWVEHDPTRFNDLTFQIARNDNSVMRTLRLTSDFHKHCLIKNQALLKMLMPSAGY